MLWHGISRVEAPAVGAAAQPVRHHLDGVVDDGGVVVVEGDQPVVAFERVKAPGTSAEPARGDVVLGSLAVARKIHPDVVEHAVEQDAQAASVRLGDEVVEIGIVAEPGIDAVVVGGVVTVCARGEDRAQRDAGRPEFDGVVNQSTSRRNRC